MAHVYLFLCLLSRNARSISIYMFIAKDLTSLINPRENKVIFIITSKLYIFLIFAVETLFLVGNLQMVLNSIEETSQNYKQLLMENTFHIRIE